MWVKLDDRFAEHPKLMAAGALTWGVWTEAMAYCNRNLTDGYIPDAVAEAFGGRWRTRVGGRVWQVFVHCGDDVMAVDAEFIVSALVDAGLWHRADGGYQIHDYADYQPTKAQILAARVQRQATSSAGGKAKAAKRAAEILPHGRSAADTKHEPSTQTACRDGADDVLDPCSKSAPVTRVPIPEPQTAEQPPPVVPPAEKSGTTTAPTVDRIRLAPHVLTATEIDLPMLEGLALQCIPTTGRRAAPMMLDNVSQRALYELVKQYGAEKVRDALLDCGGMEMPVKAAKKRLEGGSTATQRRPGADPGVFRAKGPVAPFIEGNPDEAFGPRLPDDHEDGSHAL